MDKFRFWGLALTTLVLPSSLLLAQEARTTVGFLTCTLAAHADPQITSETMTAGGTTEMLCLFSRNEGGADESYSGTVQSVSQDVGHVQDRVMIWLVKAPTALALGTGVLQQTYVVEPSSVDASASSLVGGANKAITLQSMAERNDHVADVPKGQPARGRLFMLVELTLRSASS